MSNPNAGGNVAQSGITVAAAATPLVGARVARRSVTIQNKDAAAICVGTATVTMAGATAGIEIAASSSLTLDTLSGQLYAISAAGTAANAVRVLEIYG